MNTIEIIIPCEGEQREILIALLSNEGFDQFMEEDKTLSAYISENQFDEAALDSILKGRSYEKKIIPPKNWNKDWEQNYDPIYVNEKVAVIAPFHEPFQAVQNNIVIIPKMSFGTGHHATTHLMLEYMSELDCSGKSVLDYGCGTGVLGIYAAILGAHKVVGIDIDSWCVENSMENIGLNQVTNMQVFQGDLEDIPAEQYDLILANINYNVLDRQMEKLASLLVPGGILLLSGILTSDEENITKRAESVGMILHNFRNRMNWSSLYIIKM